MAGNLVSPSLWWDNGTLLNKSTEALSHTFKPELDVYIGVGKEGLVPGDDPRVMEVDANVLAEKVKGAKNKTVIPARYQDLKVSKRE